MALRRLLVGAAAVLILIERPVAGARRVPLSPPSTIMHAADSSALSELKDTIRKQKAEIESLKKQLKGRKASSQSHGAHGGGGEESMDDLQIYLSRPFYEIASTRVGWLSLFLVSLSMTALIMNGFEKTLERQLELAYFVPLLAGHGGNTGKARDHFYLTSSLSRYKGSDFCLC